MRAVIQAFLVKARLALALSALMPLCACYGSDGLLLDADAAVHPLEDGVYARAGDAQDALRISAAPDGWYRVEQVGANGLLGETHKVLVTPLPLEDGTDGFALAEETDDGFVYAVGRSAQGGGFYLAEPDCADPLDRGEATENGGAYDDDDPMNHRCVFTDHKSLLAALVAYASAADFGEPYARVPPVKAPGG